MSRENVEIVRRAWEVVIEGISEGNLAAVFDEGLFAPASTFTPPQEVPGSKTYVGREGMIEFLRAWTEAFLDLRIWPEKIIDAGNDHVVAVMRQSAKGRGSGAPVEVRFGSVHTLEGGQIIDQRDYVDPAEALEAVGLSEQDARAEGS